MTDKNAELLRELRAIQPKYDPRFGKWVTLADSMLAEIIAALATAPQDATSNDWPLGISEETNRTNVTLNSPPQQDATSKAEARLIEAAAQEGIFVVSQPQQQDEYAWLIEDARENEATYYAGSSWTKDHQLAIRYSRKEDAFRAVLGLPNGWHLIGKPVQHGWHTIPQQQDDCVRVPVEPTYAMLCALSGEWHPHKFGNARERYAALLAAAKEPR